MLKLDFTKDFYTGETIDIDKYKTILKFKRTNNKTGIYNSQASKLYHEEKYNKLYRFILDELFDIPKCPITNLPVQICTAGIIIFRQFAPEATQKQKTKWVADNNDSFKQFVEIMRKERKGEGNPAYGLPAWNKGIPQLPETIIKLQNTRNSWDNEFKDELKKRLSDSAKKSALQHENRGMSGKKHSEETKQKCRDATIRRIKEGKFPQTETSINKTFEGLLNELHLQYEKEFGYGHFCFDFKIGKFLFEIQGDYWHCNPNIERFKNGYKNNKKLKNNYGRDISKRKEVERLAEYTLIEFWEYDINNNLNNIKLCLKKLFQLKN